MGKSNDKPGSTTQIHVGSLALEEGFITQGQLREALAERAREVAAGNKDCTLGEVFINMGLLDERQVEAFLKKQKAEAGNAPPPTKESSTRRPETKFLAEGNFGKYRILRQLGHGGMGVVYEALDPVLNRRVALKLLRRKDELAPDGGAREEERFLREARLSATLDRHPHIVVVYEAGIVRDRPYIAMELVEGRSMGEWRKKLQPTLRAQIAMLRDIASAVHVAHERGVIHRDLSPKNVLVDEDHRPHVTDFGLAKSVESDGGVSLTDPQMSVGTPHYMSPEQAQGLKTVDRRTDVYSLGVMLYEILAGRPPFEGDTSVQILIQVVRDPVQAPSAIRQALEQSGDINPELERICLKAVEKHPDDRYATALELANDLSAWLSGAPAPSTTRKPAGKGVPIALVILLVSTIGAALFFSARGDRPPPEEPPVAPEAPAPPPADAVWEFPDRSERLAVVGYGGGDAEEATRDGERCLRLLPDDRGKRHLHLDVEDAWAREVAAAEVEVEYFDEADGTSFGLQFDSLDDDSATGRNRKWAGSAFFTGTGRWATATFFLANPRFGGELAGECDVCVLSNGAELPIRRVRVRPITSEAGTVEVLGPFAPRPVALKSLIPGVVGEYFSDTELETREARRIDPRIAFRWGEDGPEGLGDRFSARWTGYFRIVETGRYLVEIRSDNGARLFIDDQPVIEQWDARAPTTSLRYCDLEAGYHRVVVEFNQRGGGAAILFSCLRERNSRMVDLDPDSYFH